MASVEAEAGDTEATSTEACVAAEEEKQGVSPSNFTFRMEANEFVPGKAFQFNPTALEFQPGSPSSMPSQQPDANPQSPHPQFMQAAFLQPVSVVTGPSGMPVYPCIALQAPMQNRPFTFVAANALGNVSPQGMIQGTGFAHGANLGAFHDNQSSQQSGMTESRKGGKGSYHRQGGHKGGYGGHGGKSGYSSNHSQEAKSPPEKQEPVINQAELPKLRRDGEEPKDEKEEAQEDEKEDEEDKGPKKTSWADIARKSMAKPVSPKDGESKILPRKVATKARGPAPIAPSMAPAPTTAVAVATSVGDAPSAATEQEETPNAPEAQMESQEALQSKAPLEAPDATEKLASSDAPPLAENLAREPESENEIQPKTEKKKEKGPLSWADRLKSNTVTAIPPQARPKKAQPSRPPGAPQSPSKAPWAKSGTPLTSTQESSQVREALDSSEAKEEPIKRQEDQENDGKMPSDGAEESRWEEKDMLVKSEIVDAKVAAEESGIGAQADASTQQADVEDAAQNQISGEEKSDEAEDEDEEEEDENVRNNNDVESASTAASHEEKELTDPRFANVEDSLVGDALTRKPDANGVIKYSLAFLKSMRVAPASKSNCPSTIPPELRQLDDEDNDAKQIPDEDISPKKYRLSFLQQFKDKAACHELPANHGIPAGIMRGSGQDSPKRRTNSPKRDTNEAEEDWRAEQAKHHRQQKGARRDRKSGGKDFERRQEEALVIGENSWANQQLASKQDHDAKVIREIKSILNKLTVEKFDVLYQKLIECGIETQLHLEKLITEVFEKVTTQHHFIGMYTDLCMKLDVWTRDRTIRCDDVKDKEKEKEDKQKVTFKRILLNQCQDCFDRYLKPPEGLEDLSEEEQLEARLKYKTKMLGNMKFVGQLLINKVLSTKVMTYCTETLLTDPSDEKLETLCAFLLTIGPAYDVEKFKHHKELSKVFNDIEELSRSTSQETSHIQPRTKFLLKDVCDLRAVGWDAKRPNNEPTGPMRMDEVKKQWDKDNKQGDKKDKGGGRGAPAPLQDADDEWATVGAARKGVAKQLSTPQNRTGTPIRPATTTNASTASNPFGVFERKSKDKKDRKDVEWRRGETTPEKSEWKPRQRQLGELERSISTDSCPVPSRTSSAIVLERAVSIESCPPFVKGSSSTSHVAEERSEKDSRIEMKLTIGELASSHDLSQALARIEAFSVSSMHQRAVVIEMISEIAQMRDSDRPCLIKFLLALVGVGDEEPRKEVFQRCVLLESFSAFIAENYCDLKCDVPRLADILRDEFFPTLSKDALSSEEVAALERELTDADADDA